MIKTITPERGADVRGNGAFGAPCGARRYNGIDYAAWPDSIVLSSCIGLVTKIGFPYSPHDKEKGHLRYVEVTTPLAYKLRYFYVEPSVEIGNRIHKGQAIGVVQDLAAIYPGITPHVHVECTFDGGYINPERYLKEVG